jgi:hypothetical protein
MTNEELEAIRARCDTATPGPWVAGREADLMRPMQSFNVGFTRKAFDEAPLDSWWQWEANAYFIAHARADIPALLAEVERLRAALERVSKIYPSRYVKDLCDDTLGVQP